MLSASVFRSGNIGNFRSEIPAGMLRDFETRFSSVDPTAHRGLALAGPGHGRQRWRPPQQRPTEFVEADEHNAASYASEYAREGPGHVKRDALVHEETRERVAQVMQAHIGETDAT